VNAARNASIGSLSGGQRQCVAIAKAVSFEYLTQQMAGGYELEVLSHELARK
jgi:ABC-type histidine transport system ATPase subunit